MQLGRPSGLGVIPDWQYSSDPRINIKINPFVTFPPGWNQRTVQPVGYVNDRVRELNGLGFFTDSWWWQNRKLIVLGGVGILGLGFLALIGAVTK